MYFLYKVPHFQAYEKSFITNIYYCMSAHFLVYEFFTNPSFNIMRYKLLTCYDLKANVMKNL